MKEAQAAVEEPRAAPYRPETPNPLTPQAQAYQEAALQLARDKAEQRAWLEMRMKRKGKNMPPPPASMQRLFKPDLPDPLFIPTKPGFVGHWCATVDMDGRAYSQSVNRYKGWGYEEVRLDGKPLMWGHLKAMQGPGERYAAMAIHAASNAYLDNDAMLGRLDDRAEAINSEAGRGVVSLHVAEEHNLSRG